VKALGLGENSGVKGQNDWVWANICDLHLWSMVTIEAIKKFKKRKKMGLGENFEIWVMSFACQLTIES